MALVRFQSGFPTSPERLMAIFDLFARATITSQNDSTVTATFGQTTFTLTGTGLTFDGADMIGGQIGGLSTTKNGLAEVQTVSLGLDAVTFQTAMTLEDTGSDRTAMEDLILPLDWVYFNNFAPIRLTDTDVSRDGVPLNFSGDDQYSTGGGKSIIYMGSGHDSGSGGSGKDWFYGEKGDDTLRGGSGKDRLYGGDGDDELSGGFTDRGATFMSGGAGRDRLIGSLGKDVMVGGQGSDTFVFVEADGADRIRDFNLARDAIDLAPGVGVLFTASGDDTLLQHGTQGATILLVGVDIADSGLITLI